MDPTDHVVAAVDGGPLSAPVLRAAGGLASALHIPLTAVHVVTRDRAIRPEVEAMLRERVGVWEVRVAEGSSEAAVLSGCADEPATVAEVIGRGRTAYTVAQRASSPVVIVPPTGPDRVPEWREAGMRGRAEPMSRVVVAVDGSARSVAASEPIMGRFAAAGVELIALHIFEPRTVPPYWDQPHHAVTAWQEEFDRRTGGTATAVVTRSGRPQEHLIDAAVAEHADLVVVPWGQESAPGRSPLVRECLARSPIPVMLLPAG